MKARAALFALLVAKTASAQVAPVAQVDRFEPSERGSTWFAADSLDLRGALRPSVGVVTSFAHRPAGLDTLVLAHVGGDVVLVDRVRVSFDLPFEIEAAGPGPDESGVGDLRAAVDVRVFGSYRSAVTVALGAAVWAPTGGSAIVSEDVFRAMPRASLAGRAGPFVWAASGGPEFRRATTANGTLAMGLRFGELVVGPEAIGSFGRDRFVELLFGGHLLIDHAARIGAGVGAGLSDPSPGFRVLVGFEWAPGHADDLPKPRPPRRPTKPPDHDHDGVPDDVDACPLVPGIATRDPKTNGCPPDTDGDGVDDLTDACPTLPGIVTDDPATNGCPDQDRDHDGIPNEIDACPDRKGPPDIDPKRNGCPLAFVKDDRIVLLDPPTSTEVLTALLAAVLEVPEARRIRIEGHVDDRETAKAGEARASTLAKWLVEHGIAGSRLDAVGVAGKPVDTNETASGRAANRRIEIHLLP